MAVHVDPEDQTIADFSQTFDVLVELLVPHEGDKKAFEIGGSVFTIQNAGSYSY